MYGSLEILGACEVMVDVELWHPRVAQAGATCWQPGALFTAATRRRAGTQNRAPLFSVQAEARRFRLVAQAGFRAVT